MRQRLALLRTFLIPRHVLLLDEPFGALDAITRREMHQWLQEVWASDARTVLFVTHDVEEALILSDVAYVMTPRPARMAARFEVDYPRPRLPSIVTEPQFVADKARLLAALDEGRNGLGTGRPPCTEHSRDGAGYPFQGSSFSEGRVHRCQGHTTALRRLQIGRIVERERVPASQCQRLSLVVLVIQLGPQGRKLPEESGKYPSRSIRLRRSARSKALRTSYQNTPGTITVSRMNPKAKASRP